MRRGWPLAAGLLGAVLLAVGAFAVGAVAPGQRVDLPGLPLCVVGLLLLLLAWWALRARAASVQLLACGLWSLPLLLAPPLASRDLYAYVGQGALVAGGLDPYVVGPDALPGPLSEGVDDVWSGTPSPYGPLWLALSGLVVRVTGEDLVPALLLTRLLAVLGVGLLAWSVPRLAARSGVPIGRATWLAVPNPLLLVHFVSGGHNDALMVGLLVAGMAVGRSTVLAAALITLAALVKVPALLALAFLPLLGPATWPVRLRTATVVGLTAAATAVAVTLLTGLGWGWLGTLDAGRARLSLFSPITGLAVALPGGDVDAVLALALPLVALICGVSLVLALRGPRSPVLLLGGALLVTSLVLPVVQPWYVLWGLPLLAATVRLRTAYALAALCLVLCVLVQPSGRSVVRPPLYGLPTGLAIGAALLTLRAGRGRAPEGEVSAGPPAATVHPRSPR